MGGRRKPSGPTWLIKAGDRVWANVTEVAEADGLISFITGTGQPVTVPAQGTVVTGPPLTPLDPPADPPPPGAWEGGYYVTDTAPGPPKGRTTGARR